MIDKVPDGVKKYLASHQTGFKDETPKKLENCTNFIIGDNQSSLKAAFIKAKQMGYEPLIITNKLSGDPKFEARKRAQFIKSGKYSDYNVLLLAGETTPKLPATHGRGGRNQHYAAVTMHEMANYNKHWCLVSASTDGADFIPGVAGAKPPSGMLPGRCSSAPALG